jgi:protein TonB
VKTLSIAIISGIFISLALFWLMQWMISNNQQALNKTENIQMTEFIRLTREMRHETKEKKIADAPPPEKRPPPPMQQMQQIQASQTNVLTMDIPNLDIPLQTRGFSGSVIYTAPGVSGVTEGTGNIGITSNITPLVRIPPRYPMRAANRHIEGWVKVEFTITQQGTVKDAVVVESQPGNIFNSAALRAIRRWKFRAKIIDNEAVEQRAVQILQFKLSK